MNSTAQLAPQASFTPGDKVFHKTEKGLGTVLDIYGDPVNGAGGDIRLDLSGNTHVTDIEPYDPVAHAAYDHTFTPIKRDWKAYYEITQDVPLRDD